VRGSHGRVTRAEADCPVFITQQADLLAASPIHATDVCDLMLRHLDVRSPVLA